MNVLKIIMLVLSSILLLLSIILSALSSTETKKDSYNEKMLLLGTVVFLFILSVLALSML